LAELPAATCFFTLHLTQFSPNVDSVTKIPRPSDELANAEETKNFKFKIEAKIN
jgi:hypothetical protein